METVELQAVKDAPFESLCESAERDRWLEARRSGIGSSDAATIVRVNPWKSPLELYAEKLGIEEAEDQSEAAYWGSILEPLVLKRFAKETGRTCRPAGVLLQSKAQPWQLATLDGVQFDAERGPGVVEVKCTSLAERWEDGPPPYVVAQVQHQLAVTGYRWGSIAVLFNGREFFWHDFERNEEMIGHLIEAESEFWRRVQALEPPDPEGTTRDKEIIAKLFPCDVNPDPVVLDGSFIEFDERRSALKEDEKRIAGELQQIENALRMAIGEHAAALLPSGVIYSLKLQHRKECVMPASSFRVLRRSERKGR
jgi:putative phage-type endonuclease